MATPRLLVLLVLAAVVACSPGEEALIGLRSCGEIEAGREYGNTRSVDEADVVLFSRPGRYTPAQASEVAGLKGDVSHISRTFGPCGQQDLFLSFDNGQWCAAVLGRTWAGSVCWEDLAAPAALRVPVHDLNGDVLVVWAPGLDRSHVLAETGSGVRVAAFIRSGVALVTVPGSVGSLEVVDFDGSVERVLP